MIEALFWGGLGASALLIGAVVAFLADVPKRVQGLILAFGAGTLFGAVAYELFEEAVRISVGGIDVAIGFGLGATVFYLGSLGIDRLSPEQAEGMVSKRDPRTSGLALVLGAVLAAAGLKRPRILGLWVLVVVISAFAAAFGFGVLGKMGPHVVVLLDSFAAGAILAMLAESMIPEAYEQGGRAVGLATTFGFAIAAALSFQT